MSAAIRLGGKNVVSRVLWGWSIAALLTLIGALFFWIFLQYDQPRGALAALCLILALSLYSFWRIQDWGMAKFDGFGAAIILFMIGYKLLNSLDFMLIGPRYEAWPTTLPMEPSYEMLAFKGEMITQFGVLLLSGFWRIAMGNSINNPGFLNSTLSMPIRTLWGIFIAAAVFRIASIVFGAEFGPVESIAGALYFLGISAIYFIADRKQHAILKVCIALALGIVFFILALTAGMKEDLIVPLIPAGLHAFRMLKGSLAKALLVIAAVISLAIVQSFVTVVRETAWANNENVPVGELSGIYLDRLSPEYLVENMDDVMSRINMTNVHAVTIAVQTANGYYFNEIIGAIPAAFIPRMLWPDKPSIRPGVEHTQRIWGVWLDQYENVSSTSAGIFTELYLAGGLTVVILGVLSFASLHAVLYRYLLVKKMKLASHFFSFYFYIVALRFDELHVVYAFTSLVLFFIIIYFAHYVAMLYERNYRKEN